MTITEIKEELKVNMGSADSEECQAPSERLFGWLSTPQ
jgi:hypothetical protein